AMRCGVPAAMVGSPYGSAYGLGASFSICYRLAVCRFRRTAFRCVLVSMECPWPNCLGVCYGGDGVLDASCRLGLGGTISMGGDGEGGCLCAGWITAGCLVATEQPDYSSLLYIQLVLDDDSDGFNLPAGVQP